MKDADEFMLRTVERAMAGIRLVPDYKVQHRPVVLATNRDQIDDMTPVDADEMDRALCRDADAIAKYF